MIPSDHNISGAELTTIFNDALDRSAFIWDYRGFRADGNDEFYIAFIDEHINSDSSGAFEDAVELSIAMDYFKLPHLHIIEKGLSSKLDEDAKLLCLDWLYSFFEQVPKPDFERLNKYVLQNNKSELINVQALLNLLLMKNDEQLITSLKTIMGKAALPAVFYRLINVLDDECFDEIKALVLPDIKLIIEKSGALTVQQKDELTARLQAGGI
ncbi:hypothetical protein ACFFGT_27470 [Mucilaginibacter angelicae]|uniref:Uncharacterized protein n=1 Tax=Mucilaginibacter angelicae TaxID=869718 RepID=A0ABV6LEX4_9SPHI